jgi:hypothetical protein
MAEFDVARTTHRTARDKVENKRTALLRATQELKRLARERAALARQAKADDPQNTATVRLREVERLRGLAETKVTDLRTELTTATGEAGRALDQFSVFTDPVQAFPQLDDEIPIALFPLRIETRFKRVERGERVSIRLCARVFPDDVLIDTFQPEISETELRNVTIYWTHRWRAGGDPSGHRSAWAALVRSHGGGRAKWLTEQVKPLNLIDEPERRAGEHLLVVRPPAPLPLNEQEAIASFWERVWSTSGAERDAAFEELEEAVGEERASEIEVRLVPENLLDKSVRPSSSITPVVVFLDLPAPATLPLTQDAWTRAARAWLLPERLVLLGFRDGEEVLRRVGAPIPSSLQIGPDPAAEDDDQIAADDVDLNIPEPLRWTVDFDDAVAKGMGFEVDLTELGLPADFERLFVLGIRAGSDSGEGAAEFSELITRHQSSRKGFAILPQGRATNNTDSASAGYSWWEDPAESFKHFFETNPADDPLVWQRRKDGAWLAGMLGIDRSVLRASPNYYGTDQAEARAINIALWPATLGYYMEQMLEPVFSQQTVDETRSFFNRFVIGRGTVPLVRIGRQPYGILPTTVWSKMNWWEKGTYERFARALNLPNSAFLNKLHGLMERAVPLWSELAENVSNVGDTGKDPHQLLLDIVGLHPTAAEFYQRYSQSFTQYYNMMGFATEPVAEPLTAAARRYISAGLLALAELGWVLPPDSDLPELLEKIFLKKPNLLKGELVQAELSDTAPLNVTRADALNYIAWLQTASRTSHDALRRQEGFANGIPTALLYLMLHHALDLGFVDAALNFHREAFALTEAQFKAERKEPKFIQVADQGGRSRWESLYQSAPVITNDPALRLGDYISRVLFTRQPYLNSQVAALDVLKVASSGGLERAFVEHIDCLTYRLDAWRMGMQAAQLSFMRRESDDGFAKSGLYIGAYGWLENVRANEQPLGRPQLDAEQQEIFVTEDDPPLMRDPTNFGHIHAPSLDQAVTGAILRNGHLANATPAAPDLLAVDLTSERVRQAQHIMEGVRNGQSLGALLGYQLERALHDEPDLFLDRLIYDLRREFPLAGNRNRRTKIPGLRKITTVEARNVLDGVAFVEHLAKTNALNYPYGLPDMTPLGDFSGPGLPTPAQIGAITDRHVAEMRSMADAVADLEVAESVYQVVRGNYDRAAGMMDALSKGNHPPVPEVALTPRDGKSLTHRVALHFRGSVSAGSGRPRAQGEPALAQWLAGLMPDLSTVFAKVTWQNETTGTNVSLVPSMNDLGLAPVDLFYMLDAGGAREMPGFDDLLIDFAERTGAPAPRHDAVFTLEYKPEGVPGLTLFEVAPLIRSLRAVVLGTRPLRASDLSLQNEASGAQDATVVIRADKVQAVQTALEGTRTAINNFISTLETAIGEGVAAEAARDAARDRIDQWIRDYAAIVRPVTPFGLQAASLTVAVEGRRPRFTALLEAINEIVERWEAKRDEFDDVITNYAALPGTATDEERIALLLRAGRVVSTTVIAPLPPTIADLEAAIATLRGDFDTAFADLISLRDGAARVGATLSALTAFVPVMVTIDQTPFHLDEFRDSVLAFAQDLLQRAIQLRDDINRRLTAATAALTRAATALGDRAQAAVAEAAHALLGEAFIVLPEFTLSSDQLAEWNNVWTTRASLLTHLTTGPDATPFPVDDWLHGVARVRDRCRQLELTTLLSEALSTPAALSLEALQFPHRPDNAWLGLKFPDTLPSGDPFVLNEDKLLYSAYFGPGAQINSAAPETTYSGLLLDEWIEVVPTDQLTTGLAFHFSRPNSEAPQAILLVTPPEHKGNWEWQNLVDTLHETLDFARLRAVEPAQLDKTALSPLLPAVMSAVTMFPITAMLNFAFNNNIQIALEETQL